MGNATVCERVPLPNVTDFGFVLSGVGGIPKDVTLRCGVDRGIIIFIAIDDLTGKHVELLVESDLSIAVSHLIRGRQTITFGHG